VRTPLWRRVLTALTGLNLLRHNSGYGWSCPPCRIHAGEPADPFPGWTGAFAALTRHVADSHGGTPPDGVWAGEITWRGHVALRTAATPPDAVLTVIDEAPFFTARASTEGEAEWDAAWRGEQLGGEPHEHYFPEPEELGCDPEAFPAGRGNCACGASYTDDEGA
jgi:hypothetical protein